MITQISTTKDKIYRQYLELLKPLLNLRKREADVLAEIMYYNDLYKSLPDEVRFTHIFHSDTRKKIGEKLDISMPVLYNNISSLKKKGILIGESLQLHPKYRVYLEEDGDFKSLLVAFKLSVLNGAETKTSKRDSTEVSEEV